MDARSEWPVLVGVDGSDSALEAVRWAAREAARRQIGLRLVAAVPWTVHQPIGLPRVGQDHGRDVALRLADEHLSRAVDEATRLVAPDRIESEVRGGAPTEVLRDESARAGMLVVGNRGRGGFTGLLTGSVSTALTATSACPVVVYRGVPAPGGTVVVGVDGSAGGDAALGYAFEEACRRQALVVAVRAWSDEVFDPAVAALLDRAGIEQRQAAVLEEALAPWREKYPDVRVRTRLALDSAARTLVAESGGAELVVVGSRGHGALVGLLLGSVSRAVVHHSHCPVAVVRRTGTPTEES